MNAAQGPAPGRKAGRTALQALNVFTADMQAGVGPFLGVVPVQGLGAALSPALGGGLAEAFGYPASFATPGSVALGSLALWLGFAGLLEPACATAPAEALDGGLTRACA